MVPSVQNKIHWDLLCYFEFYWFIIWTNCVQQIVILDAYRLRAYCHANFTFPQIPFHRIITTRAGQSSFRTYIPSRPLLILHKALIIRHWSSIKNFFYVCDMLFLSSLTSCILVTLLNLSWLILHSFSGKEIFKLMLFISRPVWNQNFQVWEMQLRGVWNMCWKHSSNTYRQRISFINSAMTSVFLLL